MLLRLCSPFSRFLFALALLTLAAPSAQARRGAAPFTENGAGRSLSAVSTFSVPALDRDALVAAADERELQEGAPRQFAEPVAVAITPDTNGSWEVLSDGTRLWRLQIDAPGATDLNLGFDRYELPAGAMLYVVAPGRDYWEGPYTEADNAAHGELWLPVVPGSRAVIELYVPAEPKFEPEIRLAQIGWGFRDWFKTEQPIGRQGSCNNDVICPEGDPWRDDISAVAVYQLNGSWTCTGTMVMNTANDFKPYFLTANHCGISASNDQTMVLYWNFESPVCGQLSGGSLAENQTGAIYRASYSGSDFCLVELEEDPDPISNVYFAGWDNSGVNPPNCVAIHHPGTDEKAISFNNDPLTVTTYLQNTVPGDGTHWRIDDWEDGTTEPGSSGSGIWDPNHRLVGQLHGGFASCTSITSDWYGRVAVSWNGGGSSANRLRDWLDPGNTGATTIDGSFPSGVGSLRYESYTSTDDCVLPAFAGGNGIWEPGESIELAVTIRASGGAHTNISGQLSTTTPGVTITDASATWPDLASGATSPSNAPHFQFGLDPSIACGTIVDFSLDLTSAEGGPWTVNFSGEVGQSLTPPGLPLAIPDNNGTGATSTLAVADDVTLTDVNVRVQISHTYVGDLKIVLQHPDGTLVTLLDRPGVPASTYGCGDNDMNVTFDSASGVNLESYCSGSTPWYSGVAAPFSTLNTLNGKSSAGTWRVIVTDNAGSDTGSILDWELLTTPPVTGTCEPCTALDSPEIAPTTFGLSAPRPNPFGERTELRFQIERAGDVQLEVYDVAGRHVRTLLNRAMAAGSHVVTWDGRGAEDRAVATGIYFVRLTAGEQRDIRRVSLVR
ncbi:MAG: proprotein convertase P-domain-containing protein [bacterium]